LETAAVIAAVRPKKPITNAVYIREKYGPVPKHGILARDQLEREGAIKTIKEGKLTRIVAARPPDVSIFSQDELKTVDYWIDHIDRDHTATSISEESHDYAWNIAAMGEELPLYAVLANRIREPNAEELGRLKQRAKELGLL
jgi:hypothetical protein